MLDQKELTFILLDIDYIIGESDTAPTIRLFGKTKKELVLIKIKDFLPYFFITKKAGLREFLTRDPQVKQWLQKIEEVKKKRYFGGEILSLLKVYGSHPERTPQIRERVQRAGFEIHEADIPFVKRFLLDTTIGGLNVLTMRLDKLEKFQNKIVGEGSYRHLRATSKTEIPSADFFYKLKILAFDIEVDQQNETIQQLLEKKDKRITAISVVWGTTSQEKHSKVFLLEKLTNDAERTLLEDFLHELEIIQPDVLTTFNGDKFDLPYLLSRMEKLNIPSRRLSLFQEDQVFYSSRYRCYRIKGRISYDLSPRTWGIHPISGKKGLGDIAETLLGKTKVEISQPTGELWRKAFLNGDSAAKEKLYHYSLMDSQLTYDLFWKLGINGWLEIIRLTGYPPGEAPGSTERIQGEFELMRFAKKKGVLIPMAPSDDEIVRRREERRKNPHAGGTVLVPKGRLHLAVIISDFRSMYPSVCVAHNIGGETLKRLTEVRNANPLELFRLKPQSCLSLMEETLINRRQETKQRIKDLEYKIAQEKSSSKLRQLQEELEILDKEQYSLKIVANSMYGAHNYIRSRFYSITLGNAITNIARTYILRMEEYLKTVSKKVTPVEIIYGDTDSAFIKMQDPSLVVKVYTEKNPATKERYLHQLHQQVAKILAVLNKQFPSAMELTLEDIAYKLIFKPGRAKAYSYFSILKNELKITGFEAIRSDWSLLARESQKKVLKYILTEPVVDEKSLLTTSSNKIEKDPGVQKAKEYLLKLGEQILTMPFEELLPKTLIRSPLRKNPKEYKTKVPVIQAFLDYVKREGLNPDTAWQEFDKFPWVITPGRGIISDRARHPKYAKEIDREYYLSEILRASRGFGIKLSVREIKMAFSSEPIDEILKRFPAKKEGENSYTHSRRKRSEQTKLSGYLNNDEKNS